MSGRQARLRKIWSTIRDIPAGNVASYGQIAELSGLARGARQVGWALRNLPQDEQVPWFRVLQASGRIAFAKGSDGFERQRRLLEAEGVTVTNGRVSMREYRWQPDLDELLWKPDDSWDVE